MLISAFVLGVYLFGDPGPRYEFVPGRVSVSDWYVLGRCVYVTALVMFVALVGVLGSAMIAAISIRSVRPHKSGSGYRDR